MYFGARWHFYRYSLNVDILKRFQIEMFYTITKIMAIFCSKSLCFFFPQFLVIFFITFWFRIIPLTSNYLAYFLRQCHTLQWSQRKSHPPFCQLYRNPWQTCAIFEIFADNCPNRKSVLSKISRSCYARNGSCWWRCSGFLQWQS